MELTYTATLLDDRLEWCDAGPPAAVRAMPVMVHVTILKTPPAFEHPSQRGQHMADVLTRMAAKAPLASIADPAGWEREIRADRVLPNRE